MSPGNHRFVKTALAILGLIALVTVTVWTALFMFVKPAKGETVDARKVYVIDGDTIALASERIRLLAIDRRRRATPAASERVAGYKTKARGYPARLEENRREEARERGRGFRPNPKAGAP